MPAPAPGTSQLARTRERRHRTARARTSTGGCARRSPGTTPRDGSSSLPTSTTRAWSPTRPFALPEGCHRGVGTRWVHTSLRVQPVEAVGQLVQLLWEQVAVA